MFLLFKKEIPQCRLLITFANSLDLDLFDTQMEFLKEFFEKVDYKKKSSNDKKA